MHGEEGGYGKKSSCDESGNGEVGDENTMGENKSANGEQVR